MSIIKSRNQPQGFTIFFLTEMWERYGFYVIQTLLVFYLLNRLGLNDTQSYVIVGSFTALAYINSVFGGLIADRILGSTNTVILGGVILFIGYFILGMGHGIVILTTALGAISVGTGLLKPNVSSLLSVLYPHGDERKDAGYTLYYVGIYVGALAGSFLGGYIQKYMGWSVAFLSSALGILIGTFVFMYGKNKFSIVDSHKMQLKFTNYVLALLSIIVIFLVSCAVLHSEFFATIYFVLIAVFCLGLMCYIIASHRGVERTRMIAFLLLIVMSVCYWAIYFQQFFSISLCTERLTNTTIPISSIPAVESLAVILCGPLIARLWYSFKDRGYEISIPSKFSLSFIFNSLCFLLLSGSLWIATATHSYLSIWLIMVSYILVAIGELCISPTSLAMVSSLVPKRFESAMMGVSLLSIGFGGKLAGLLASSAALSKGQLQVAIEDHFYLRAFFSYFIISVIALVVSMVLGRQIKKLIQG